MASVSGFAEVASLAGDPARAAMLHALMDGRALTAGELAKAGGVTPQTASGHLMRLTASGLLAMERQGRHRCYRLGAPVVAQMLESIMRVASATEPARRAIVTGPRDKAMRRARTCYDHLAGRLGVALADALVAAGHAELDGDAGAITATGHALFARLGIELDEKEQGGRKSRILCRPCLDWSERRPHLAGRVGAALCTHSFSQGWIRRMPDSRAVAITAKGERALREHFAIRLDG